MTGSTGRMHGEIPVTSPARNGRYSSLSVGSLPSVMEGKSSTGSTDRLVLKRPARRLNGASPPPWSSSTFAPSGSLRTISYSVAAGAVVRRERLQGKGHVVRRMFADIDSDVYILVDGDDTYDAGSAPPMVNMLIERQLDMVSAARLDAVPNAYRPGHRIGNQFLSGIVSWAFGRGITDMLSGYRVFSRRFVKSFPALSCGFETETEFTVHALALHMPMQEVRTPYKLRPAGSKSKLNTWIDGIRILRAILTLIQHERPLQVFSATSFFLLCLGAGLGLPVVTEFLRTGQVPRLPTAVLATGLELLAFLSLNCGLILDAVSRGRKESKRLAYLAIPPWEAPER